MNQSERTLIGACGIYCRPCPDYLAHINNDENLKKKLAEEFSERFDMAIEPPPLAKYSHKVRFLNEGLARMYSMEKPI